MEAMVIHCVVVVSTSHQGNAAFYQRRLHKLLAIYPQLFSGGRARTYKTMWCVARLGA